MLKLLDVEQLKNKYIYIYIHFFLVVTQGTRLTTHQSRRGRLYCWLTFSLTVSCLLSPDPLEQVR